MISKISVVHFIKYSGVSIISTLLEYLLFFFITPLFCNIMNDTAADSVSTAACYILATILCYILNKYFVFKSKERNINEAIKFFLVATPKMLMTTLLVPLFITLFNIQSSALKTLINMIIQTVLFLIGYTFQILWVFKTKKNPENSPDSL